MNKNEMLKDALAYIENSYQNDDCFDEDDCIYELIRSYATNHTDIATNALLYWLKNEEYSVGYMECALSECYINLEEYNFLNHIQVAQSLQIEEDLAEHIDEIKERLKKIRKEKS